MFASLYSQSFISLKYNRFLNIFIKEKSTPKNVKVYTDEMNNGTFWGSVWIGNASHRPLITKCYHGRHIGSRSSTRSTSISSSSSALMSCGSFVLFLIVVVVAVVGRRSLRLFGLPLQFTVNFSLTSDVVARHRDVEETVVVDALASPISSTALSVWGIDFISGDMLAGSIAESISPEVATGQGATTLAMRSRLARVGDNRLAFGWREHVFCRHYGGR